MGGIIANEETRSQDVNELQTKLTDISIVSEERTLAEMETEVIDEANRDLIKQFFGIISAIIPILAAFGYRFEWLNEDVVSMIATAVVLTSSFVVTVYTIWRNHYTSKKGRKQKLALKQRGLK